MVPFPSSQAAALGSCALEVQPCSVAKQFLTQMTDHQFPSSFHGWTLHIVSWTLPESMCQGWPLGTPQPSLCNAPSQCKPCPSTHSYLGFLMQPVFSSWGLVVLRIQGSVAPNELFAFSSTERLDCPQYSSHWLVPCFKVDRPSRLMALPLPSLTNSPGCGDSGLREARLCAETNHGKMEGTDNHSLRSHQTFTISFVRWPPHLEGHISWLSSNAAWFTASLPQQRCETFLDGLLGPSQMGQWSLQTVDFGCPSSTYMLGENPILWW